MKEKDIATCAGKKVFASKRLADFTIRSERLRREKGHPYRCRLCHAWHVGTQLSKRGGRPRPPEDRDDETGFA